MGRAVVVVDRLPDGDLGGHHGLDVVAGHELDVVHGEDVRRVHHGDGQRRAGPVDRHDEVLLSDLRRHQLGHLLVDFEVAEVDRGHAVLLGEELSDVVLVDESELDEIEAELAAVFLLMFEGRRELLLTDQARLEQHLADLHSHLS